MRASHRARDLIKQFEGKSLEAYLCSAGRFTIGYGHTGPGVHGGMKITEEEAERLLSEDIANAEVAVNALVAPEIDLTQNQFDALVSFTFNVGKGNLRASTLLRMVNDEEFYGAGDQFLRWVYAGDRVVEGLRRRRQAERQLFLAPD